MSKNFIMINKQKVYIDHRIQTSPLGRDFIISGIGKDATKEPKYLQGVWRWCWIYTFKYLDDGSFFGFYFDYNDVFSHKI